MPEVYWSIKNSEKPDVIRYISLFKYLTLIPFPETRNEKGGAWELELWSSLNALDCSHNETEYTKPYSLPNVYLLIVQSRPSSL